MSFIETYKSLEQMSEIPEVVYFSGWSRYLKDKCLDLLLSRIGMQKSKATFLGPKQNLTKVLEEISQTSFLESQRLIVVLEVERFKSPTQQSTLLDFVKEKIPRGHYVVFETVDSRKNPKGDFFDYLKESCFWADCRGLKEYRGEVTQWVSLCLEKRDKKLSDEVVRYLADLYKKDLYLLESEIEKLCYYTGEISVTSLEEILFYTREVSLQPFYDMVAMRNGPKALEKLSEALRSLTLRQALNGFSRFLHQLLITASMSLEAEDNSDIAKSLDVNPFFVKRLRAVASRYSIFHLTVALNRTAKIDTTLRLGGDTKSMFQNLIYTLCESPEKLVVGALSVKEAN